MKTKIATVLLSIAAATGFCDEAVLIQQPTSHFSNEIKLAEKVIEKKSFSYVRLGVSDKDAVHTLETVPGLGIGYRYAIEDAAIDFSANYTGQFSGSKLTDTYFYTLPKASYLRYVSSDIQKDSFYYGAGLAVGGVKKAAHNHFGGLIPSVTAGYEIRNPIICSFVQVDVSQPLASISRKHDNLVSFKDLPGPLAEVSFGLGF